MNCLSDYGCEVFEKHIFEVCDENLLEWGIEGVVFC